MTPEQRVEWEKEVRSLYDGLVRIVVTPTWPKLIDFETTLPSAVEELIRQRDERREPLREPLYRGPAFERIVDPVGGPDRFRAVERKREPLAGSRTVEGTHLR